MDSTTVILYTNVSERFKEYRPVKPLPSQNPARRPQVSLIATIKDDAESVVQWCEDIFNGIRLPDEIIIVDGGSHDEGVDLFLDQARLSPVPIQIIEEAQINIAQGRNIAIQHAQYSIIAVTDLGCRPEADWLQNLIFPFDDDPQIAVVAGWYQAVDRNQEPLYMRRWPTIDQISPQDFIPSSRSLAFKKHAWQSAGGYPEWLTLTGEDTLFAYNLKKTGVKWAFVPDAIVRWRAPDTMITYWKKQYMYSFGDGEAGLNTEYYRTLSIQIRLFLLLVLSAFLLLIILPVASKWIFTGVTLAAIIIATYLLYKQKKDGFKLQVIGWEVGAKIAQFWGFIRGLMNKKRANNRRDKLV